MAEAKEFSINGQEFKRTASSHYYVKQGEKWCRVKKAEFDETVSAAENGFSYRSATVKFLADIPKPVRRKLSRRYAKGIKGYVAWFDEVAGLSGLSHGEIKRHLKAA